MSTKVKRKVTVESSKETDDQPRRPSVFERLGPGALNMAPLPTDRRSRQDHEDRCRNWERTGNCSYGNTCRYKHETFSVPSSTRRPTKTEKDMDKKDLRHKVRNKRDEPKEPRTASASPKKKGSKRSISRSRKGEHESKIKSTVVVTRPRSPGAPNPEITETKKKGEGNWEDDSDDWPMDAAQLDYKEELTLERKRQQLQRELELELQKERLLNENVTITKTVSFSGSSSSSSSSDSGSISSSSGSSSSSSEEDSNESTSSSSSSSSSSSHPSIKKKNKKTVAKTLVSKKSSKGRMKDDYDKIKSGRAGKSQKHRSPSPAQEKLSRKKGRDKRTASSMSPKRKKIDSRNESGNRSNLNVKAKGPRTPSPVQPSRKQRQWAQSSSADSRSAEVQRGRNKRHKKKKDIPRSDKRKVDRGPPTPPHLSSPNRTALMPLMPSKKVKSRDESGGRKSRHRVKESPPMLLPRNSGGNSQPTKLLGNSRYITDEKIMERNRSDDRGKVYSRKDDVLLLQKQRNDSHERVGKRSRVSPRKENRKGSLSPHKERYEPEIMPIVSRKMYMHEKDKTDRRRLSASPVRSDRRKPVMEVEKKRDVRDLSPRDHDPRRDNQYRSAEIHGYDKRGNEAKVKRLVSPDGKKGRDDRGREYPQKERVMDYESSPWQGEHRKGNTSVGRRSPESRGRPEMHAQTSLSRNDRSREHDPDRKKRKDRDLTVRSVEDAERSRLSSPRRSQSPIHGHHGVREIEPLTDVRGRIYEPDVPPVDREYAYSYDPLHDPYMSERLLPPEYEADVLRGPALYPPDVYPESRYRRDVKEPLDRYGPRDVMSPRDILPHRDIISLTGRSEEYLTDVALDDRSYDERWSRGRGREEWDPYSSVPPAPLPPHVAAALDEDRYGMPRRRRASPPEWQRNRLDDRDTSANLGHRPPGRGQLSGRDGRSRSPPPAKGQGPNRGSWNERGGRHDSRNSDNRVHEDTQKNLDDRKGRNIRKDRIKRKEDTAEEKTPISAKERGPIKRPHSPSPIAKEPVKKRKIDVQAFDILKYHGAIDHSDKVAKEPVKKRKIEVQAFDILKYHGVIDHSDKGAKEPVKKRKIEVQAIDILKYGAIDHSDKAPVAKEPVKKRKMEVRAFDILKYHGAIDKSYKARRLRAEANKPENKSAANARNLKTPKQEVAVVSSEPSSVPEKDIATKNLNDSRIKKKEDRKLRKSDDTTRGEDDFSDWSDDDLDLLTRDDFAEVKQEGNNENSKHHYRDENEDSLGSSKRRDKGSVRDLSHDSKKSKESNSRTSSKDRSNEEPIHAKDKQISEPKDINNQESFSIKEDTATDIDEYITAESVDYDPISDDELDALIEEPDDSLTKPVVENEKSKIVDALDVDWSALMKESEADFVPGFARRRFKAAHVLSRIGFSQSLAGPELSQKIIDACEKQLNEEEEIIEDETTEDGVEKTPAERKKFAMEHKLASFHVSISQNKKERTNLFREVGPYRRALCARRDLQIRKMLCKPLNKFATAPSVSYTPQYTVVDKELYKQSLELLKLKKTPDLPPQTVPVCS